MSTPDQILSDRFGLERFRPGQEEVIGHLLAGRSAVACFPTGGGKSLCYQLPALLLPGLTLVISPLLALMKEQIDRLQGLGIAADRLDSTREVSDLAAIGQALRTGKLKLLYVSPERFTNERFRAQLQGVKLSLFAVDEAHCISEWGHNFRPDYLKLAGFARRYGAERVLALTATATPQVLLDICRGFDIDPGCVVRTGFHRDNLSLHTTPVEPGRRDDILIERLQKAGPTAGIVYVTLQATAEKVAGRLVQAGLPARAYHAGMEDEDRVRVQEWFAGTPHAIVAATIAFGMGIDKADIRGVYHYNLPKSLENWAQEMGRAGRDGQPAHCEVLVCPGDMTPLENFVYGDTPAPSAVRGFVRNLFGLGEEFEVSIYDLAAQHDIRLLVLNTLLAYLELDGYLEAETPVFSSYQFRPLASFAEILQRFDPQRQAFLNELFQLARQAKVWYSLDLEQAMQGTGAPRERILRALDYLKEKGLMEVKADSVRHRFRRLRQPDDPDFLAGDLLYRSRQREQREIHRLHQVLELIEHDGCQVSRLGQHFGEGLLRPCGRCTWCLGGRKAVHLPARACPPIPADLARQVEPLRQQHEAVLGDPRALTRFLCGLTTPRLTREKLTREKLFGVLAEVPFARVLACRAETGGMSPARWPSNFRRRPVPQRPARFLSLVLLLAFLPAGQSSQPVPLEDPLPSWNDGKVKQTLLHFVKDVSDPKSKQYVRPGERIATFDNDGTLWVEQPMYPEMVFAIDRLKVLAKEKPDLKERQPFKGILEEDRESFDRAALTNGLDLIRLTHGGMTPPEFTRLARQWRATARQPRYNRLYTECVYQPQLELLTFLRANGFHVWICTGGGLQFMRCFAPEVYKVPFDRIIGSEILLRYEFKDGKPLLLRTEELVQPFNDHAGKPIGIQRFIGRKPILTFGNSDGDQQMLEYTDQGEAPRLMLLLRHDDPEREYDYSRKSLVGRLDKALDETERRGWLVVSFKRDFKKALPSH